MSFYKLGLGTETDFLPERVKEVIETSKTVESISKPFYRIGIGETSTRVILDLLISSLKSNLNP